MRCIGGGGGGSTLRLLSKIKLIAEAAVANAEFDECSGRLVGFANKLAVRFFESGNVDGIVRDPVAIVMPPLERG